VRRGREILGEDLGHRIARLLQTIIRIILINLPRSTVGKNLIPWKIALYEAVNGDFLGIYGYPRP